jgi:hypothetical protein
MRRSRRIVLLGFVGSLLIPVLVGKILDVGGSFPAAFGACAAFEALALACAAFTRETGLRNGPSW